MNPNGSLIWKIKEHTSTHNDSVPCLLNSCWPYLKLSRCSRYFVTVFILDSLCEISHEYISHMSHFFEIHILVLCENCLTCGYPDSGQSAAYYIKDIWCSVESCVCVDPTPPFQQFSPHSGPLHAHYLPWNICGEYKVHYHTEPKPALASLRLYTYSILHFSRLTWTVAV